MLKYILTIKVSIGFLPSLTSSTISFSLLERSAPSGKCIVDNVEITQTTSSIEFASTGNQAVRIKPIPAAQAQRSVPRSELPSSNAPPNYGMIIGFVVLCVVIIGLLIYIVIRRRSVRKGRPRSFIKSDKTSSIHSSRRILSSASRTSSTSFSFSQMLRTLERQSDLESSGKANPPRALSLYRNSSNMSANHQSCAFSCLTETPSQNIRPKFESKRFSMPGQIPPRSSGVKQNRQKMISVRIPGALRDSSRKYADRKSSINIGNREYERSSNASTERSSMKADSSDIYTPESVEGGLPYSHPQDRKSSFSVTTVNSQICDSITKKRKQQEWDALVGLTEDQDVKEL
jgi:hypothetical protein